jgi:hypothetical protein
MCGESNIVQFLVLDKHCSGASSSCITHGIMSRREVGGRFARTYLRMRKEKQGLKNSQTNDSMAAGAMMDDG